MLLIEELVRFGAGLDEEHGHPVADAAAARWGLPRPRFVRSSASHVLVAGAGVLRLRPVVHAPVLHRAALAARQWHEAGAPVVTSVTSRKGRLVEVVEGYAAMSLALAHGPTLEELGDGLPERAGDWGEALALLHATSPALDLPDVPVVASLGLPRSTGVFGVLHGDPEADNVVVTADGLRFVDPDEVRLGWFAADVAFALRDWEAGSEVPRRFLAGYRRVRPLTEVEESWLPALAQAAGEEERARLAPHLAARPQPGWPEWALRLDRRIRERAGS